MLNGNWPALKTELAAIASSTVSTYSSEYDRIKKKLALEENIRKSIRAHLILPEGERFYLMTAAARSGIGLTEDVLVRMVAAIIQKAPSDLCALLDGKLTQGEVPVRIFVDLGIRLSSFAIDHDIQVVSPSPHSWWADDGAFDDPKPMGSERTSRLTLETNMPFTALKGPGSNFTAWHDSQEIHLRRAFDRLQSAFLAIGLSRTLPIPATYNTPTTQHLGWGAELFSSSYLGIRNRPETNHFELSPDEQKTAIHLYNQIYSSGMEWREKFWIPITRLMSSSRGHFEPLDLVDLRTALEAYFVDENERGISHSLALRFARLEGETLDRRRELLGSVKKIYRWTSQAVHRGKLDKAFSPDKTMEIIKIFRNRLVRTIGEPPPIWRDFDLT